MKLNKKGIKIIIVVTLLSFLAIIIFNNTFVNNDSTSIELKKDEETVLTTEEVVEVVEEEKSEENETEVPKEETKVEEEQKEDDKVVEEKPSTNGTSNNTSSSTNSNASSNTNNSSNNSSSANNSNASSNSSSSNNSNNSNTSSNSSSTTKPETQKPVEVTKPVETPQPVKVTGVSTNGDSMTLEIGQSKQMTVSVSPANADNKAVKFTSANTAVATVDANGNIKAIGAGTTVIKATSVENSNIFTSIAVTVNAKKEEVKQPTYTANTILNRTINELGWCKDSVTSGVSYLAETGCNTSQGGRSVSFNAHSGANGGVDAHIAIYKSGASGVVSGVETIIRWMMPTQGQQLINKMHDPNYYGGTHTFDGRKVVVAIESYGITVTVYGKY